jgi:opacity protein-like surface antigen
MKRAALSAILLLIIALGSSQAAIHIHILGGYALPTEKNYAQAFAYGAGLSFDLHKYLAIELSGIRYESSVAGSEDGLSKGTLAVLPFEVSLKGQLPLSGGRFTPYFAVGAGYSIYQFSLDPQIVANWEKVGFRITEKLDNAIGFHFGAGLEVALNRSLALVFDAKYRFAEGNAAWTMTELAGNEEISGDLEKLDQGSIVLGIGLKFSLR